jgi:hypothetical protein
VDDLQYIFGTLKMKFWAILILVFVSTHTLADLVNLDGQHAKLPPLPFQLWDKCTGEKCGGYHDGWIARDSVKLYKKRSLNSDLAFNLKKDESFEVVKLMIEVHKYGTTKVLSNTACSPFKKGDLIYEIVYVSEGFSQYWYRNTFMSCQFDDIEDINPNSATKATARRVSQPNFSEWAKVKNSKGLLGWSNEIEKLDNQAY